MGEHHRPTMPTLRRPETSPLHPSSSPRGMTWVAITKIRLAEPTTVTWRPNAEPQNGGPGKPLSSWPLGGASGLRKPHFFSVSFFSLFPNLHSKVRTVVPRQGGEDPQLPWDPDNPHPTPNPKWLVCPPKLFGVLISSELFEH